MELTLQQIFPTAYLSLNMNANVVFIHKYLMIIKITIDNKITNRYIFIQY